MNVAFIPARGGSRGIPGKNLALLGGVPLLAHTVRQARAAAGIDRIVCSTDDEQIKEAAKRLGCEIVSRPAALATDMASTEDAMRHFLQEDGGLQDSDVIVLLQVTSPFRGQGAIDAALRRFDEARADSLVSVVATHRFRWHVSEGWAVAEDYAPAQRPRRQDLANRYVENGSIYVTRVGALLAEGHRLAGSTVAFVMPEDAALEIDSPWDLDNARALWPVWHRADCITLLRPIKMLAVDCDGVLTDNRVAVSESGAEAMIFNRGDGYGLHMARERGIELVVISREENPTVEHRCAKLKVKCLSGVADKAAAIASVAAASDLPRGAIAFMGNDLPDIPAMQWVGVPIAVADADPEVVNVARIITTRPGGGGAVREICDWLVAAGRHDRSPS